MSGFFVVIDGPDGAGKTTLARAIAERIRGLGREVVEVREPGGTPAAELARQGAFSPELDASGIAELFFVLAARADLVSKVIAPSLLAGKIVLSDRFDLSTEAYQIGGRGFNPESVRIANRLATDGLQPDLTIVVDVPVAVGRERQRADGKVLDRMERESLDLHQRVHAIYVKANGPSIHHVDGNRAPDAVEDDTWEIVKAALNGGEGV